MKLRTLLALAAAAFIGGQVSAQEISLKTNALYWATATPNLAVEFGVGQRMTVELAGGYNNWPLGRSDWANGDNKRMSHFIVRPSVRYWFGGYFAGAHLYGGEFNVQGTGPFTILKNNRHEGYFLGGGVSAGHRWQIGCRWAIEAELGVGYAYVDYERYGCSRCDPVVKKGVYHYFGPTRLGVSFVYNLQ